MLRGRKRYILLPPEECLKLELLPPGHPRYATKLLRQAFSFYSIRVFLVFNRFSTPRQSIGCPRRCVAAAFFGHHV